MLKLILTDLILYTSTALDLLVILMVLFARYQEPLQRRQIYLGQFLGSYLLIGASMVCAYLLHWVPAKWLLGFLGVIPIILGIRCLLSDGDEAAAVGQTLKRRQGCNLLITVALITLASCGADNLGLFIPYFVTLTVPQMLITLVVFTGCIYLLVFLGDHCAHVRPVKHFLDRFGDGLIALIYVGLGIMIIVESGTLPHLVRSLRMLAFPL